MVRAPSRVRRFIPHAAPGILAGMQLRGWLSFALVLAGCGTTPAAPVGTDAATDIAVDAASDLPAIADTGTDLGLDAATTTDATCEPRVWDSGVGEAGAAITEVRQFLTNCRHNENTDMLVWHDAIYLIHRTYDSQVLSPDARLHLYRSTDQGVTFQEIRQFNYPARDIRDPKLVPFGNELRIYSLSRLPGFMAYDLGTDSLTTVARSTDGTTWSEPTPVYESGWSFWREIQVGARLYAAAYQDGDRSIIFLESADGLTWNRLATVFSDPCRIPLEPEPMFFPDGRVVIGIRMDDGPNYLDDGHEKLCVADPPYTHFECPTELPGRLDGPVTFEYGGDRWVIARAHLSGLRKRTVLYRWTGNLHDLQGVGLELVATLPSAGDTSYAGLVWTSPGHALVSYYTSNPDYDIPWWHGSLSASDIFMARLDMSRVTHGDTSPLHDRGVITKCRPFEDGGTLFPDVTLDATSSDAR